MKGFPVRRKMTRDNWRRKPRRCEVRETRLLALWERKSGKSLQIPQNCLLNARLFFKISFSLLPRSVEAEGHRDPVSAGGEGAALQGDVGASEPRRGGLPAGSAFLQVGLQSGAPQGGLHHVGRPAGR